MSAFSRRIVIKGATASVAAAALPASALLPWAEALADTESSGISLWAMKNLSGRGSAFAKKAGDLAFDRVLTQVGIPTPDAALGEVLKLIGLGGSAAGSVESQKLDAIKLQLDAMNRTLLKVADRIADLQRQLDIAVQKIKVHVSEEDLKRHVNAIDRLFGASGRGTGPQASLMSLMASAKQGQRVDVAAFRGAVDSNVQSHIDGIGDALTTKVGSNNSLLEQWAGLVVLQTPREGPVSDDERGKKLLQGYRLLESYFTQALGAQFKGLVLRAAAYGAAGVGDGLGRARREFYETLRTELDLYLTCVERLMLCQLPYSASHLWPTGMQILRRADVLNAGLLGAWNSQAADLQGLFGGSFGRILLEENDTVCAGCFVAPGSQPGLVRVGGAQSPEVAASVPDVLVETRNVKWLLEAEPPYFKVDPDPQRVRVVRIRQPIVRPGGPPNMAGMAPTAPPPANVNFWPILPIDPTSLDQASGPAPAVFRAGAYLDGRRVLTGIRFQSQLSGIPNKIVQTASPFSTFANEAYRTVTFLRPGLGMPGTYGPAYTNKFTFRIELGRNLFRGGPFVFKQIARTPLCTTDEPDKLALFVSGGISVVLAGTVAGDPPCKIGQRVAISIVGDNGTSVPLYDSTRSPIDATDRPPDFKALAAIDAIAPFETERGVKYDLFIEFTSSVWRLFDANIPLGYFMDDQVALTLDTVALQRAQGVGFDT
jgi:hypothetical protein